MTYARPFLRLVAQGSIYSSEDWSFSMSLMHGPVGGGTPPDTVPPPIVTAFTTFITTPNLFISEVRLEMLKLNHIGTDGRYTEPETVFHEFQPPIAGTGSGYLPAQIAFCVSLQTGVSRGRAHAGRFYLPGPSVPLSQSGTIPPANLLSIKAPVDKLLQDINGTFNDEWVIGVTSSIGTGAEHPVTNARYGHVLDTIRSRRASLVEDYEQGAPL